MLLGKPDTKRAHYLGRAAREAGLHVLFLDWDSWKKDFPEGKVFLKIDPPVWDSCFLGQLGELAEDYRQKLGQLGSLAKKQDVRFFNHPEAIGTLLNKRECKDRLRRAGLAVTEELPVPDSMDQLLEIMDRHQMGQVFIKPSCGSGAAGVAAFRRQKRTGQMVLYTCARQTTEGDGLINTKKLRRITDSGQVVSIVEKILKLGCVVERWYAKAEYQGYSYDLRAVVQDGKMDFCLARLSEGPVTNLHLNNHPLEFKALGLSGTVAEELEELCRRGMEVFPGLRSAGIDILLEKGSLKPRIIEMNAQGDLIYQDIYGENVIYKRQAEMIRASI